MTDTERAIERLTKKLLKKTKKRRWDTVSEDYLVNQVKDSDIPLTIATCIIAPRLHEKGVALT